MPWPRPMAGRGLTLVELLISLMILGILAAGASGLVRSVLQAREYNEERSALFREGLVAMERMTAGVRTCTYLLLPEGHAHTRNILAFSGRVNDDNDYYFDDPLFPRIDEDPPADMTDDGKPGILGIDDDNDTNVDEGDKKNDDEVGSWKDEDPFDGSDDDGDGSIDEDSPSDKNNDGKPGLKGFDDDGDGSIDEGDKKDDDEDDFKDEDPLSPVVYTFDSNQGTLYETVPSLASTENICSNVKSFTAVYDPPDSYGDPTVTITLVVENGEGESFTFTQTVFPENLVQRCGKRVR